MELWNGATQVLSGDSITFSDTTPKTLDVIGVFDREVDGDQTFDITATTATAGDYHGESDSISISNLDVYDLIVEDITPKTTGEDGSTYVFGIKLDSKPTDDVTVAVTVDEPLEATVTAGAALTFEADNSNNKIWSDYQYVTITGVDDDIDDGDIAYQISITSSQAGGKEYGSLPPLTVNMHNQDNDTNGISLSNLSGNTSESGGTATFDVVLDAKPTANVIVTVVSDDASEGSVTAGASLTFQPSDWSSAQSVTISGVDDPAVDGDISYSVTATADNNGGYLGESSSINVVNINNDFPAPPPPSTPAPTPSASPSPTAEPTPEPSAEPSPEPSAVPSPEPTPEPVVSIVPTPLPTPAAPPVPTPPPGEIDANNPQLTSASDLAQLSTEGAEQITPGQINQLPPAAFTGLNSAAISALPPESIGQISDEQLKNINPQTLEQSGSQNMSRFIAGLDPQKVSLDTIKALLPEGWEINSESGELIPPPGEKIGLPVLSSTPPSGVNPPPQMPDLNKSLSVGGQGGKSFKQKANEALANNNMAQFAFEQDRATGKLSFNDPQLNKAFSLSPDPNGLVQAQPGTPPGVALNNEGFFVLTTPDNQQLTIRPAPQDPSSLANNLNGEVHLGNKGDVLVRQNNQAFSGLFGFDVRQMPEGTPAGVIPQDDGTVLYVFESGLAQKVHPAPNNPDLLTTLLNQQISGVENLVFNADGTVSGSYNGRRVTIQTYFDSAVSSNSSGDENRGEIAFNQLDDKGNLVLLYKSPVPQGQSSNQRARFSASDVTQRVTIRLDDAGSDEADKACLATSPGNFVQFIETIAKCRFVLF